MDKWEKTYIDFMSKDPVKIMREKQKNPNLSIKESIQILKVKMEENDNDKG
tara:strand:+ start:522 stop:674 length:153 start_codon:yes stop_codon:yes gene_type:complete